MSSSIRRERYPIDKVCQVFCITRSTYYDYRSRSHRVDTEREALKQQVERIFHESRGSAGTRTIKTLLAKENIYIGRILIGRLMSECHLSCKQPSPHRYKVANTERPDIPNKLNREFNVNKPNQVWCGDITYIWAGSRWIYLAVIIDLYARKVVGWAISEHADQSIGRCLSPSGKAEWGYVSFRSGFPVQQPSIPATVVALPLYTRHESSR